MKLDALDHPKTFEFAAQLGVELPTALGHLELLWAFTGKQAPQGNIGKWPDGAIARACYWMGRPELFIQALHKAGFLDSHEVHRFTIHDWHEHAPRWVRAKLKSLGTSFIMQSAGQTGETPSGDTAGDTVVGDEQAESDTAGAPTGASSCARVLKGSEGKRREVKGSNGALALDTVSPPVEGLNAQAWNRWLDYRTKIRKPLKPVSFPAAQRELAAFGCDQDAVVEQSIAQGWQGLFALKKPYGNGKADQRLSANMSAAREFMRRTEDASDDYESPPGGG